MTQYTSRGYPTPEKTDKADVPGDMKKFADAVSQDVAAVSARTDQANASAAAALPSYPTPSVSGWGILGAGIVQHGKVISWTGALSRNGGSMNIGSATFTTLGTLSGASLPTDEGWGVAVCDGVTMGLQLMSSGTLRVWSKNSASVSNGTGIQFSINWKVA